MKKFLIKTFFFSIPVVVVLAIPVSILKLSGENYNTIDEVIEKNKNYLIGYAYNETNYSYLKWKELNTRDKQIIVALGSSRILQFRNKMFDSSFYNAGYTVSSISDFTPFIKTNLVDKSPAVLLITLDQWMFNKNWDDLSSYDLTRNVWNKTFDKNASSSVIMKLWADLFKKKYDLSQLAQNKNSNEIEKIGLNAVVNNIGFRKDGSMYYGKQITKLINNDSSAKDYKYSDTYLRIEKGDRRFEHGNQINSKALIVLNDLLAYCKRNNIYVIGILPPFADKVNMKLKESGNYKYMDSIFIKSNEIFNNNSFELWDMTNLNKYGSNDQETIDGFHGGEVSYLKMLIYMVENGSALKNYTSLQKLKSDLDHKVNNYIIYE